MVDLLKYLAFIALTILIVYEVSIGVRDTKKITQLPFLFSGTYLLLVYPTLLTNINNPIIFNTSQFAMYAGFSFLCLGSASGVYRLTFRRKPNVLGRKANRKVTKLVRQNVVSPLALLVPMCVGLFFTLLIDPREYGEKFGGVFAIQLFLARLVRPVAIIAWSQYLWSRCKVSLAIAIVSFLSFLPFVFISGRRSDTLFILLAAGAPLMLVRGWRPTRKIMAAGLSGAFFIYYLWPTLREYTKDGNYGEMGEVSLSDAFTKKIDGTDSNEAIYAAERMQSTFVSGEYSGIAPFVNSFVNLYVSSTVFGKGVKEAFSLDVPTQEEVRANAIRKGFNSFKSREIKWWLSPTGAGDAFSSLGWFGFLYFAGFAAFAKWLYVKAQGAIQPDHRILYCLFIVFIPFAVYDSVAAVFPLFLPYYLVYIWALKWRQVIGN